jgi:hypothetical protein
VVIHDTEGHKCATIKHFEGYGQGNPQAMNLFAINTLKLLGREDDPDGTDHYDIERPDKQEKHRVTSRDLASGSACKEKP